MTIPILLGNSLKNRREQEWHGDCIREENIGEIDK
jgi:hypothetical protein